jgi:hypothetical protein
VTWTLPSSPDSKVYTELIADIAVEPDERAAREKFRAVCEADYYFLVKYALTFGKYKVDDVYHPRYKRGFWVDDPYVFDLCREVQQEIETRAPNPAHIHPRKTFKSELVNRGPTIWLTLKDPSMTTCMLTFKVDTMGENMYSKLKLELEKNSVLLAHWPDVLSRDTKDYELWTNSALTVLRDPGPTEPTVSIHSLSNQPTSGHFRRIVYDDTTIKQTVETRTEIVKTIGDIRHSTALGSGDTLRVHIGTIWDANDPNMELNREGYFSRWNPTSCWRPDGSPVLHSARFWRNWEKDMGEYIASAQLHNAPVAKGRQVFRQTWMDANTYKRSPAEQREGLAVVFFLDLSYGKAEDYTALSVIGLGADRHRNHLDLYREKFLLSETWNLLFTAAKVWKPALVLLQFDDEVQTIQNEQEHRKYRFRVVCAPPTARQRDKEARIQNLQTAFERGEHHFPAAGFGHGSKDDPRDTMRQFFEDEYRFWTPKKNSTLNDDMLDAMAWPEQPEVQDMLPYPEDLPSEEKSIQELLAQQVTEKLAAGRTAGKGHSAWVN